MKIDSSTVGMNSARSYRETSVTVRRFMIAEQELAEGNQALNTTVESNGEGTENAEQKDQNKTKQAAAGLEDWQNRLKMSGQGVSVRDSISQALADIRETTLRYIFDILFSNRRHGMRRGYAGINSQRTYAQGMSSQVTYMGQQQSIQWFGMGNKGMTGENLPDKEQGTLVNKMKVLNYSQETIHMEKEETSFSTVGKVRTADGREIDFQVNVGMSREFEHHFVDDLQLASFKMCDPLVINLDTDVTELSDQTFYFDIDADGEMDEISQLGAASGYLALDKNGDGQINDGSELFGTASGNGFADLAEYDEDGNGWIDENDAIWDKLKIWCKDKDGKDVLYKLSDKGVGAICLHNVSTEHTLKGQEGQTRGAIRNTGIFLYENGNVGTVQHVDVAKYDSHA